QYKENLSTMIEGGQYSMALGSVPVGVTRANFPP
ncbi:hypothetical protein A2U01_0105275, partial [Trifolium medium]|nr:hypothetical protein [Trifolium medium]